MIQRKSCPSSKLDYTHGLHYWLRKAFVQSLLFPLLLSTSIAYWQFHHLCPGCFCTPVHPCRTALSLPNIADKSRSLVQSCVHYALYSDGQLCQKPPEDHVSWFFPQWWSPSPEIAFMLFKFPSTSALITSHVVPASSDSSRPGDDSSHWTLLKSL